MWDVDSEELALVEVGDFESVGSAEVEEESTGAGTSTVTVGELAFTTE
jgi:hypothetical protein